MRLEHQELEKIFCLKISAELSAFQYDMLQKERKEIYQAAYQIVVFQIKRAFDLQIIFF